jgi:rhamnose transport system permease protein
VLQVSPFWQSALTGLVILAAVLINARGNARRSRQILPQPTLETETNLHRNAA